MESASDREPPVPDPSDLFQEWRAADRAAHAMELMLTRASLKALDGRGPAPTKEDQDKAHQLRVTAHDLFELAMAEMKARAEAHRRC